MKFSRKSLPPNFLGGKGLGNEIAFYIFDYPPEAEIRIRDHIRFLMAHIPKRRPGLKVKHINLFDLVIDHLENRDLLEKSIQNAKKLKGTQLFKKHLPEFSKPRSWYKYSGKSRSRKNRIWYWFPGLEMSGPWFVPITSSTTFKRSWAGLPW